MSTLNVNKIVDTSGGVFAPVSSVFRNRIINGAMVISQRNGTSSVTPADSSFPIDRFPYFSTQASKFTAGQNLNSVTPPVGFSNYLGLQTASAVSVGAGDYFMINHLIEGFNTADLVWGTAAAKTVTLSFWVRSSLTGTFGGVITNSALNRSYPFTYTINSANTWEYETITIAGDTSGTWIGATNGCGIRVMWGLGAGSTYSGTAGAWAGATYFSASGATSVVGTNGATFYITGVQLEVGTQATSYEYENYGVTLQKCQRYYYRTNGGGGSQAPTHMSGGIAYSGGSVGQLYCAFPVTMRANPTSTISSLSVWNGSSSSVSSIAGTGSSTTSGTLNVNASVTNGAVYQLITPSTGAGYVDFSAEL